MGLKNGVPRAAKPVSDPQSVSPLMQLTEKQREAMDLLVKRMTSKEIARELGISPHTVDQRISIAKDKLGAATRHHAATVYQRLSQTYEQPVYEEAYIAEPGVFTQFGAKADSDTDGYVISPKSSDLDEGKGDNSVHLVGPKLFHGPVGTLWRVALVIACAFAIVVAGLMGVSVFSALSEVLSALS